MGYSAVLW
jgi:hypothetical protein